MHMLLFLNRTSKINDADQIDKFISAEIPDELQNSRLFAIVKQFMIRGPC